MYLVCMCSLIQPVDYISFSKELGIRVTMELMVCSLKVVPDLVVHCGVSTPPTLCLSPSLCHSHFYCSSSPLSDSQCSTF